MLTLPVNVIGRSSQEVAGWSSEIDSGTAAAVRGGAVGVDVGVEGVVAGGVEVDVAGGSEVDVAGGSEAGVIGGVAGSAGVLTTGSDGLGSAWAVAGTNPVSRAAVTAATPSMRRFMAVLPLRRSPGSSHYLPRCFHY
ncbi:hypothetical protein [Kribbella monticola]|uniref:hypothetical protein n=1 Tax=Kribbella monticola TaxID=2185285 RepID=UPI00130026C4|nr:hypothetical protein [Kribbella monticola]